MYLTEVYIGLGGNIGDSYAILNKAIEKIASIQGIYNVNVSRFYRATPVSSIPQDPFVNAVCHFKTSFSARELLEQLQQVEKSLGKMEKQKDAPRIIDVDILFFGSETYEEADLKIPHPHWHERLFVIAPLADLTPDLYVPNPKNPKSIIHFDVRKYLEEFPNIHHEIVTPITK